MAVIPWSDFPEIDDIVSSDFLMRRTPSRAVKNQEIQANNVGNFLAEFGYRTGVLVGLKLSINTGTTFDIATGKGIIVNREPDPTNTVVSQVPFTETLGITDLFVATDTFTFVFLNSIGAIIQRTTPPSTLDDLNDLIFLGQLRHFGGVIVTADDNPIMAYGASQSHITELVLSGGIKITGALISDNATADLQVAVTAGILEQSGRGRDINANNPNEYISSAQAPILAANFFKAFVDGTGELIVDNSTNLLDPSLFNQDGAGTLVSVSPSGRFTVIRVFEAAQTEAIIFYYGTEQFTSSTEALSSGEPTFVEHPDTVSLSPLAKIAITGATTDLPAAIASGDAVIQVISHRP